MHEDLAIAPEVAQALAEGRPVVALESALIAHGLPRPHNLETAVRLEALVRAAGAVPATIGVRAGRLCVGLSAAELEHLATAPEISKVSRADLAPVLVGGGGGATTVAATLIAADRAGIRLLATGGIGGVHRGGEDSLDVSADLMELSRSAVAVVCAGAKAILDLPRTLEVLETLGVPVVGYGTDELPAFFTRASGLTLPARVDSPQAAAGVMRRHWSLGLGGLLVANPPPADSALAAEELERWIAVAVREAEARGIGGKALTPVLLARVAELSGGASLRANIALLEANASLAGAIAVAYAA